MLNPEPSICPLNIFLSCELIVAVSVALASKLSNPLPIGVHNLPDKSIFFVNLIVLPSKSTMFLTTSCLTPNLYVVVVNFFDIPSVFASNTLVFSRICEFVFISGIEIEELTNCPLLTMFAISARSLAESTSISSLSLLFATKVSSAFFVTVSFQ